MLTLEPPRVKQSTKAERHTFWQQVVELYENSELSCRDFCQEHGLNRTEFRRWKYRLPRVSASSTDNDFVEATQPLESPSFVPLHIANKATSSSSSDLAETEEAPIMRLIIQSRYTVEIPKNFNASGLQRLLHTLDNVSC